MRKKTKGVFCLEGDWESDLRSNRSVQPVLRLLEHAAYPPIPSIRRDIGTIPELEFYLKKWCQRRYKSYSILYLGFHGDPGVIYISDAKTTVDLDWLEERLAGKCKGTVIHFGSCATLNVHGKRLKRFLVTTGALAVCGYKDEVDWMISASFEILFLEIFQRFSMTRSGMKAVDRTIKAEIPGLSRQLAFRMVIS